MMKKIGHSRAVYEVNLSEDHESAPRASHTDVTKVRQQEEMAIPVKTTSPRKEEDPKFKFTKFPVRKQEDTCTANDAVK